MDLTKLLNFAIGIATLIPLTVFVLLSLPIYIYRWIIIKVAAPNLRPDLCSPLSSLSSTFGCEFMLKKFHTRQSRCALLTRAFFNGTVPTYDAEEDIARKWILRTITSEEGKETLQYPELRQYITSWRGFLFWKEDDKFLLRNHIKFHEISKLHPNPEKFVTNLTEELLNKPFPKDRSPWELHIVHGYRNDKIFPRKVGAHKEETTGNGEMTVWLFRWHHALADGVSAISIQVESLLGISLDKEYKPISTPSQNRPKSEKLLSLCQFPFNFIADTGSIIQLAVRSQTPYHAYDSGKHWKQICGSTPFIPVDDIRTVKNAFGVSFTSVLCSCISAALSKNLMRKGFKSGLEFLPVSTPLPLSRTPNERRKLMNRFTGSFFNLPIGSNLESVERLRESEKCFHLAKQSTLPHLFVVYSQAAGAHFPAVTNALMYNRIISVGLSNFPGRSVGERAEWLGHTMLGVDIVLCGLQGVVGLSFMAFSTENYVRVNLTAEASVVDRKEMDEIADGICAELDSLLELAKHKQ